MTMTPIIKKIRDLLALSKSSNINEAATAAALAQKLMTQYRLQPHDVNDPVELTRKDPEPLLTWDGVRLPPVWLGVLCRTISEQNGCTCVIERTAYRRWTAWIYGQASDCAHVRYLVSWLRSEAERLTIRNYRACVAPEVFERGYELHGRKYIKALKDGYRLGLIRAAVDAMKKSAAETAAGTNALAVVDGRTAAAKQLMIAANPELREDTRGAKVVRAAVDAGAAAGRHLHGSAPLQAGGVRMLGDGK